MGWRKTPQSGTPLGFIPGSRKERRGPLDARPELLPLSSPRDGSPDVRRSAYVAFLNPDASDGRPDALAVLDLEEGSSTYGELVGRVDMPNAGDELHHFGWNACSAALCPWAPHPHVERRYLVVPGLRSSRIHVVDVGDDPAPRHREGDRAGGGGSQDRLLAAAHVALRPGGDLHERAGGQPRTVAGREGSSCSTARASRPARAWKVERGPQYFGYDFWWHLGLRHAHLERVGHAGHVRERGGAGEAPRPGVRPPAARVGPEAPRSPAGHRPRRRAPDGAGAAPRPRSAPH